MPQYIKSMKYLFDNISEIKNKIEKAGGAILLLDFDGVLSAIAPTPDEAIITEEYTALLKKCAARFPVAIVTGRAFEDIKKKIYLKDVLYIASHGLEWEENGKKHVKKIPQETLDAISRVKKRIIPLLNKYPGMILEEKSFTFAVHYRIMKPELVEAFIKEINSILEPIAKESNLRLDHNMKNFELRPKIDWDKGHSAKFAEEHFNKKTGKKFIPIYIGDSDTDEDAFIAIGKNGITIRVEKKDGSKAEWYMKDQKEVGRFLEWLLSLKP